METIIRGACEADALRLPDIERAAGRTFQSLPELAWIAGSEPMSSDDHRELIAKGCSWVAETNGELVGFLVAEPARDELHIVELSVLPDHQGAGIGRRLIAAAAHCAEGRALAALTLTTFRDVPWNAPFYARIGFSEVPAKALGARLAGIRSQEIRNGLASQQRCAMRYRIGQA